MHYRRATGIFVVSLLLALCMSPTAAAQQLPPQSPTAVQQPAAGSAAPLIPVYSNSPGGLQKLFKEMLRLRKNGDTKALAPYIQSLILPNSDAWFRSSFGDNIGAALAGDYERTRIDIPLSFPDTLRQLQSKHLTSPQAVLFSDSCNPNATETEYPLLLLRTNSQPLYDVRFEYGNRLTLIPYFAYVDGAFRYLGNFHVRTRSFPLQGAAVKRLRVGGNVIAASLIHQVAPIYPADAKVRGVQGTVILHALIGTDGHVHDLQVMQGSCVLAQSAITAVSQWLYKPMLLAGDAVQVDTTITVIFNLR